MLFRSTSARTCPNKSLINDLLHPRSFPRCDLHLTPRFSAKVTEMAPSFHLKCRFPNEYVYKGQDGQPHRYEKFFSFYGFANRENGNGLRFRIVRQEVPAGQIAWSIEFDTYDPISFTAPHVTTAPWADPRLINSQICLLKLAGVFYTYIFLIKAGTRGFQACMEHLGREG